MPKKHIINSFSLLLILAALIGALLDATITVEYRPKQITNNQLHFVGFLTLTLWVRLAHKEISLMKAVVGICSMILSIEVLQETFNETRGAELQDILYGVFGLTVALIIERLLLTIKTFFKKNKASSK